jgi:hypothetical protein
LNWDFHGVEFVFENIALPDSNVNEPQSHGFVSFSIFPFPGLPEGGLLSNRVDIYFDQNPAVSTNRVETIVQFPVDLKPETQASRGILIFPNPTTGTINVKLPEPAKPGASIRITDLAGRLVQEQTTEPGSEQQIVHAGNLPSGMYFLQILSQGRVVAVDKFVKQ